MGFVDQLIFKSLLSSLSWFRQGRNLFTTCFVSSNVSLLLYYVNVKTNSANALYGNEPSI